MSEFHRRRAESEGRRGSTIDLEEGGRYLGIPQNPGHAPHQPVTINPVSHEIGGGTVDTSRPPSFLRCVRFHAGASDPSGQNRPGLFSWLRFPPGSRVMNAPRRERPASPPANRVGPEHRRAVTQY